jgi:hypothetical protein
MSPRSFSSIVCLYFLRDKEDNALRVRATVIRAQFFQIIQMMIYPAF